MADTFTRIEDGTVFRDNDKGSFVAADGEELEPGWKTDVGLANFSAVLTDPLVRDPFMRVFVWTFAFASLTVLFSFALGLFLAIALDKPGLRFQRSTDRCSSSRTRSPASSRCSSGPGLLNDDFGVVNNVFDLDVPWLFDPNWAKVSVHPRQHLAHLPLLLPRLDGRAPVDPGRADRGGAGRRRRRRGRSSARSTLPLLLVAVAPLLIASFAFNFNNFNNIYLLTGGGPPAEDQSVAGATDILITYTYKIAFESGQGAGLRARGRGLDLHLLHRGA